MLDQQAYDLKVTLSGGKHQGCDSVGIDSVNVCTEFNQQADHVDVALVGEDTDEGCLVEVVGQVVRASSGKKEQP